MPNRIIRNDLLSSERYWRAHIEARELFVHLLLTVDDFGCYPASPFAIARNCLGPGASVTRVPALLSELSDHDLIRLYEHDGEQFLFIPRFKQWRRAKHPKYPLPPKEISDIAWKCSADAPQVHSRRDADATHRETKTKTKSKTNKHPCPSDDGQFAEFWLHYPRKEAKARAMKAFAKVDPDVAELAQMIEAIHRQRESEQWRKDDGRFIPLPATWLNGRRWEDEDQASVKGTWREYVTEGQA